LIYTIRFTIYVDSY